MFFFSLSLQASRVCQSKQKQLEQGFRSAFREFQQWLVNSKINTAKCFDVPQNLTEASACLLKIQVEHMEEFLKTLTNIVLAQPLWQSVYVTFNLVIYFHLLRSF